MKTRGYVLILAFLFELAASPSLAQESPALVLGDANADGVFDSRDVRLLNDAIYARQRLPLERLRSLDIDQNGYVNLDDLVRMVQARRDRQQLGTRTPAPSEAAPQLIPRWAYNVNVKQRLQARFALAQELNEVADRLLTLKHSPSDQVVRDIDRISAHLAEAQYYGLLTTEESGAFCRRIDVTRNSTDFRAVERWVNRPARGSTYLQGCAARLGNTTREVQASTSELCWRYGFLPIPFSDSGRFSLDRDPGNGNLRVSFPVTFNFDSDVSEADQRFFLERVDEATGCMRTFWSRYGVTWRPEYGVSPGAEISVHAGNGRENTRNLYVSPSTNLCTLLLHEFGHLMGLPDEYEESGLSCSSRQTHDLNSLMDVGALNHPMLAHWNPQHLFGMFGSVCGPYPTNEAP